MHPRQYQLCGEAADGAEAVLLAKELNPDLIILDFSMPVMDGLEAARELKKLTPNVPIIMFTQHSDEVLRLAVNAPVNRIVPKDRSFDLMAHVRTLIPT